MLGRTVFGGVKGWIAASAAAGAIALAAGPARASEEFERAFKYESGRIAANIAAGAGLAVLGGLVYGPGYYPYPPRPAYVPVAPPPPAYGYAYYAVPAPVYYPGPYYYGGHYGHHHHHGCGHGGGHGYYGRGHRKHHGHGHGGDWDD
jgi:hypothetical protein